MSCSTYCTPTKRPNHYRSLIKPLTYSQNRLLRQNKLCISKQSAFGEEAVELIDFNPSIFPQSSRHLLQQIQDISTLLNSQSSDSTEFSSDQLEFAIKNQNKISGFLNHNHSNFYDPLLFFEIYAMFFNYRLKIYSIGDLHLNCVLFGSKQAHRKIHILQNAGFYYLLEKFVPTKSEIPHFKILYREEIKNEADHKCERTIWILRNLADMEEMPSACFSSVSDPVLESSSAEDSDFEEPSLTKSTKVKKRIFGSCSSNRDCDKSVLHSSSPFSLFSFRNFFLHSSETSRTQVGRLVFYNHHKGFGGLQNPEGEVFFVYKEELARIGLQISSLCVSSASDCQSWFEFQDTTFILNGLTHRLASRLSSLVQRNA